jgi:hypothetical protein
MQYCTVYIGFRKVLRMSQRLVNKIRFTQLFKGAPFL